MFTEGPVEDEMAGIELKYGAEKQSAELPFPAEWLRPQKFSPADPERLIHQALQQPLGTPPLAEIVKPQESVVIVVSDITRYSGSEIFLPILVEELNRIGVPDEQISILVALGIHRRQTATEHRKILGPLAGRIAVYDHDCDDPQQLVLSLIHI